MNSRDLLTRNWVCGWMCLRASVNAAVNSNVLTHVKNQAPCWHPQPVALVARFVVLFCAFITTHTLFIVFFSYLLIPIVHLKVWDLRSLQIWMSRYGLIVYPKETVGYTWTTSCDLSGCVMSGHVIRQAVCLPITSFSFWISSFNPGPVHMGRSGQSGTGTLLWR